MSKSTVQKIRPEFSGLIFMVFLSKFKTLLCCFSAGIKLAAGFKMTRSKGEAASRYLSGK